MLGNVCGVEHGQERPALALVCWGHGHFILVTESANLVSIGVLVGIMSMLVKRNET